MASATSGVRFKLVVSAASRNGRNLKAFTQAFACIGKLGGEVTVEARPTGLYLRGLNDSKQAFVEIAFPVEFFAEFELRSRPSSSASATPSKKKKPVRCKLSLKCCAFALRRCSPKQVARLALRYETSQNGRSDDLLHFETTNRTGVSKAYAFVVESTDVLLPSIDEARLSSGFAIAASGLLRTMVHISGTDEIVLTATTSGLKLASLHDEDGAPHEMTQLDKSLQSSHGALRTALLISADDFDALEIPSPSQLKLCVKELKAVLQYVSVAISRETVRVVFSDGGEPLVLHGGASVGATAVSATAAMQHSAAADVAVRLVLATALGANLGAEVASITEQQRSERARAARRRARRASAAPSAAAGVNPSANAQSFRPPPRSPTFAAAVAARERIDRAGVDRSARSESATLTLSGASARASRAPPPLPTTVGGDGHGPAGATPSERGDYSQAAASDRTLGATPLSPFAQIRALAQRKAARDDAGRVGQRGAASASASASASVAAAAPTATRRGGGGRKRAYRDGGGGASQSSATRRRYRSGDASQESVARDGASRSAADGWAMSASQAPVANSEDEAGVDPDGAELDWNFPE